MSKLLSSIHLIASVNGRRKSSLTKDKEAVVENGLMIKGKGGVPAAPDSPLNSHNIIIDDERGNSVSAIPEPVKISQGEIQPARGVKITESNEVILTAYRTKNSGDRLLEIKRNCSYSHSK